METLKNYMSSDYLNSIEELFNFETLENELSGDEFLNMSNNEQNNKVPSKRELEYNLNRKQQDYGFLVVLTTLFSLTVLSLYGNQVVAETLAATTVISVIKNMLSRRK